MTRSLFHPDINRLTAAVLPNNQRKLLLVTLAAEGAQWKVSTQDALASRLSG
ncbi:MAG TPA: hypothetical protein VMU48_10500 [Terracidiphilus sp.]|nr:hypothetical protein [Terracidiphilus sp.]